MGIYRDIDRIVKFALAKGLIHQEDIDYSINRLLQVLNLKDYHKEPDVQERIDTPNEILDDILDWAFENCIIERNTPLYRDILDSKIMDCFMPRPSEVVKEFERRYIESPEYATEYYYDLSRNSNYIRTDRIKKNIVWKCSTEYGELDITINLSKPEKDPMEIAAARSVKNSNYPECLLCKENVGYSGRINHPGRSNHRIIPVEMRNENWFLQYSPYSYYREHSIIFNEKHVPMKISKGTFQRLLEVVSIFPHYFAGSNADLPIVGGSILSHDHFQGGRYKFAMERASLRYEFKIDRFPNVHAGLVKWPMSVIRLTSSSKEELASAGALVLEVWRGYSDKISDVISHSGEIPHNTVTPIARRVGDDYELDIVLRNNRCSKEHPQGIFHPHEDLHHIKKENIGLIEVMGLAVLPARLKSELEQIKDIILGNKETPCKLRCHREWIVHLKGKYKDVTKKSVMNILREEVGVKFTRVLEDAGVFKLSKEGDAAFKRFIQELNK